jgi:hypothetical protein
MPSPFFADLTGVPVASGQLTVPYTGIWHADVKLTIASPAPLVGPQVLNFAGSTWVCSVVRYTDFAGSREVRLVGGQGGWRKGVPAKQYSSPIGVPIAVILTDVALSVLELTPNLAGYIGAPVVGTDFVRQTGLASLVLQQLLGDSWWMDSKGVIQTAPRLPTPILSAFSAIAVEGKMGHYTIATEHPADWAPGAIWAGITTSGTVSRVTHTLEGGTLKSEVLSWP